MMVSDQTSWFLTAFIVVFVLNIALAFAVAAYGRRKGFPLAPILVAALFVSAPLTWLIVALMPPRDDNRF